MAFRQQIGPAASAKQLQRLQALIEGAGYATFRIARGPLGLTQRQGLGKFSSSEADELIEQLEQEAGDVDDLNAEPPKVTGVAKRPLQDASTASLVAELEARGWTASKS